MKLTQNQVAKYFVYCNYTDGWDFAIICAFLYSIDCIVSTAIYRDNRQYCASLGAARQDTGQGQMQVALDSRWLNVHNTQRSLYTVE